MSQEEIRQQHDTIKTMAQQIKDMKKMSAYLPLFGVLGTLLSGAFALGVFLYKYDVNVVKQQQFASLKTTVARADSILNFRVDTTNKRIDNQPKIRFTNVTQHRDKSGNFYYKEVN